MWIWSGAGAFVLLVVLGAGAWVGIHALQAKSELQASMPLVSALKSQIVAQNIPAAAATFTELQPKVDSARKLTDDPIWRVGELIPVVGTNLSAVRQLASVTDDVVNNAIQPLMGVADTMTPASFKPVNGAINLAPFEKAIPKVDSASAALTKAVTNVQQIKTDGAISQVVAAKASLQTTLTKVATELTQVRKLLAVLPGALGGSGARNYLIVFENNGEMQPGGGTTGSMAILHVDHGKIALAQQSSASGREFPHFDAPVVPIPADAQAIYPFGLGTYVQKLTETPRFLLTYDIAKSMWKTAKGVDIDGVVALDTVALSYLVNATGPIHLPDGTVMTGANAVKTMLGDLYVRHSDPAVVDAINQTIAITTFQKVTSGSANPKALIAALLKASNEGRMKVWTSNAAEQALIKPSSLYGAPPQSTATTDAFGVYYMDKTPSKMGYYLRQNVSLNQAVCPAGGKRYVQAKVTLTNAAPANAGDTLPVYVTGDGSSTPRGTIRVQATVYAPKGYSVVSVTSNGAPAPETITGTDGEFVVGEGTVAVPPGGGTAEVTVLYVSNSTASRTLLAKATPVVNPTVATYGKLDCGQVPK